MACKYTENCPFYNHQIPIHELMYKTNLIKYCNGQNELCAIYIVIEKKDLQNVPKDLYPNQNFRLKTILINK